MKKYRLTMSIDAINIDAEKEITADKEPGFWMCYEIAAAHGCDFWILEEV